MPADDISCRRTGRALVLMLLGSIWLLAGCGGGGGGSSSPTAPNSTGCLDRAVFGDAADSPYVLPYPVGEAYEVITSYCSYFTLPDRIGLDFDLPMGSRLLAARSGVAIEVVDGFDDNGASLDQNNFILIQHGDGSVAFYSHIRQGSARIETGDSVGVGDRIADSGAAGAPFAHLHFTVYRNAGLDDRDSLPINFRNADGPLDERGGLISGQVYTARPY